MLQSQNESHCASTTRPFRFGHLYSSCLVSLKMEKGLAAMPAASLNPGRGGRRSLRQQSTKWWNDWDAFALCFVSSPGSKKQRDACSFEASVIGRDAFQKATAYSRMLKASTFEECGSWRSWATGRTSPFSSRHRDSGGANFAFKVLPVNFR